VKEQQAGLIEQAEIIKNQIKAKGCASEDDLNALKAIELDIEQNTTHTTIDSVNNLFSKVKKHFKLMFKQ
jgi:phosphoribosylformylglycinamidine (FGAM) synthase PurS component